MEVYETYELVHKVDDSWICILMESVNLDTIIAYRERLMKRITRDVVAHGKLLCSQ